MIAGFQVFNPSEQSQKDRKEENTMPVMTLSHKSHILTSPYSLQEKQVIKSRNSQGEGNLAPALDGEVYNL